MKKTTRIVRWESTADSSRCGIEVCGLEFGEGRLEAELDRALGRLKGSQPAFVIAGFASSLPRDLAKAISQSRDFSSCAHVCLALDYKTLLALDPAILRDEKFGVLLDQVDASTPLSAISAEPVEALRFEGDFVQRASTDLRLSCIVDSMLKLAHDLGLATLGSTSDSERPQKSGFDFDYVCRAQVSTSASVTLVAGSARSS